MLAAATASGVNLATFFDLDAFSQTVTPGALMLDSFVSGLCSIAAVDIQIFGVSDWLTSQKRMLAALPTLEYDVIFCGLWKLAYDLEAHTFRMSCVASQK
jgi:hypothetical protein